MGTAAGSGRPNLSRLLVGPPARTPAKPALTADPGADPGSAPDSVVAWGWYVDGVRQSWCRHLAEASQAALEGRGFVWLGLHDPSDEDMAGFATQFNLHPLAIEDAVEGHTRSKLEQFGDTLFVVASTVSYVAHTRVTATSQIVSTGQVMVFLGEHFVMTVRRGPHTSLGGLREQLEADPHRLAEGPSTVLYAVLDQIVDEYLEVVSDLEEDVDEVEAEVFSPGNHELAGIYQLKRELIEFKRATLPLELPLQALARRPFDTVPDTARAYFREVADHHVQARDATTSMDEVLNSILQFAQAQLSYKDNQDMRKISAWVAIIAVPTMVAGFYGMNFEFMPPETQWRHGYYLVIGIVAALMIGLAIGFRRNKWL